MDSDVDLYTSTINLENAVNVYRVALKEVMAENRLLKSFFEPNNEFMNMVDKCKDMQFKSQS